MGSIPGQGTKIPHAAWRGQKKKKQVICKTNKQTFCLLEPSCYPIPTWSACPTPSPTHSPSPAAGENSAQVKKHSLAAAGLLGSEMVQTEDAGTLQVWVIKPQGGGL